MDELESVIERHIRKRLQGEFTLPGLLIKAAKRPATKKRGRNPATGEEIVIPAACDHSRSGHCAEETQRYDR